MATIANLATEGEVARAGLADPDKLRSNKRFHEARALASRAATGYSSGCRNAREG